MLYFTKYHKNQFENFILISNVIITITMNGFFSLNENNFFKKYQRFKSRAIRLSDK